MNCINCGKELTGNQKKFCSRKCKYEYYKKENEGTSYNSAYSKCKLLCANCHAELHNPEMAKENCGKFKEASKGIKRRKPHNLDILNISQCSE